MGDCFLAVLSSHGEEGCVFGADGKPVRLSRIFTYFDNEHMETKAKVFLIQVGSKPNTQTDLMKMFIIPRLAVQNEKPFTVLHISLSPLTQVL